MSYYLGLVGLGLFFVLLVHLYNRWTYYVFQREEMLAKKSRLTPLSDGDDKHMAMDANHTVKPLTQKNTPHTSQKNQNHATIVGNIKGMVAESTQQKFITRDSNVIPRYPQQEAEVKPLDIPINLHTAIPPEDTETLQTHQSFFVLGMETLSADELYQWLSSIQTASPFVVALEILAQDKCWHTAWSSLPTLIDKPKTLLSPNALLPLIPVVQIEVVVQLANRRGHLTLEDWQSIERGVLGHGMAPQEKWSSIKLHVTSIDRWLARAQHLDSLCAEYDMQIALTLMCRESAGVSGGQVSRAATQEGMVFSQGLFHKMDAEGNPLFSLDFAPTGSDSRREDLESLENHIGGQVTLSLDIPRVVNGQMVFQDMARFAQHLAGIIRADLVDDRGHQLSSVSLDTIGEQVQQIQAKMKAAGLPAGSLMARQLFV